MKIIIAICIIACVAISQAELTKEQKDKAAAYKEECVKSTSVPEELVNKARNGDFPDDESLKKFLLCFGKKVGFMNEAGEFQKDVIMTKIGKGFGENASKVIETCTKDHKSELENAYQLAKCLSEHAPKDQPHKHIF